jgi:hypothetical protein
VKRLRSLPESASLCADLTIRAETPSATVVMAASASANTPSKAMENEPESSPNTMPDAATTKVMKIDARRTPCSVSNLLVPPAGRPIAPVAGP